MVLNQLTVFLFCVIIYYQVVRGATNVIINGIGAFKETKWQSLMEGLFNVGLSIALAKPYGINGVLFATVLSHLLIGFWYVPVYVFRHVFKNSPWLYYKKYLLNVLILVTFIILGEVFCQITGIYQNTESLVSWFKDTLIFASIVTITYFAIYFVSYRSFRDLVSRFLRLLI